MLRSKHCLHNNRNIVFLKTVTKLQPYVEHWHFQPWW